MKSRHGQFLVCYFKVNCERSNILMCFDKVLCSIRSWGEYCSEDYWRCSLLSHKHWSRVCIIFEGCTFSSHPVFPSQKKPEKLRVLAFIWQNIWLIHSILRKNTITMIMKQLFPHAFQAEWNVFKFFVSYEWVEARDGQFGSENEFGNWSGLVGELQEKVTILF